jgi:hypothetical protein
VRFARSAAVAAAAALLIGGPLLVAWMMQPDAAGPCVIARGPMSLPELPESSGLAVSLRNPGLIWSHNDSGNEAVLFGIDPAGTVRARVRLPVRTRDWEDISIARCGTRECLYVADIGDNRHSRDQVLIYRLPEPAATDTVIAAPDVFSATYPDGPHNAEGMFVAGDAIFVVTRDLPATVYRSAIPSTGGASITLQPIARLGVGPVTDAEAFRDGTSVIVRTSHEVALYRTADLVRGAATPYFRMSIDGLREAQGEGVALDGSSIYLSSEGRPWNRGGRLITLRCDLPQ